MSAQPREWTTAKVVYTTLGVLAVVLGFWLLFQLRWVLFVFLTAVVIGTALGPLAKRIHRLGLSALASVSLLYASLALLVITFFLLFTPLIVDQVLMLSGALPEYYQQFRAGLVESPTLIIQQFARRLPAEFALIGVASGESDLPADVNLVGLFQTIGFGMRSLFVALAILLLSFNWMLEGDRATRTFILMLPPSRRDGARELIKEMESKVGAYIRSQAILMLLVGSMALVAYLLLGLPYAFVLAVFAGVMEAVPFVGPILGAIPALLVAITFDPSLTIWVIVASIMIQQIENVLLVPRVMNETVGVNPVVALLAIFSFGSLYGLVGVLLAIPIAAVLQTMLDRFLSTPMAVEELDSGKRGQGTRLRYQLRDLLFDIQKQAREHVTEPLEVEEQGIEERVEALAGDLDRYLSASTSEESVSQ